VLRKGHFEEGHLKKKLGGGKRLKGKFDSEDRPGKGPRQKNCPRPAVQYSFEKPPEQCTVLSLGRGKGYGCVERSLGAQSVSPKRAWESVPFLPHLWGTHPREKTHRRISGGGVKGVLTSKVRLGVTRRAFAVSLLIGGGER